MALAIAVTAGVNYKMISDTVSETDFGLSMLIKTAFATPENDTGGWHDFWTGDQKQHEDYPSCVYRIFEVEFGPDGGKYKVEKVIEGTEIRCDGEGEGCYSRDCV